MAGLPQGDFNRGANARPPSPVAVQQTTVIQVGSQKSVVGAVLLAFFFGPLGMLYATVPGALIMFVISFVVAIVTFGLGLLITLPICAIWAGIAASSHNNQAQGLATHQAAVSSHAAVSPAGWHDDPEGSGRLRYYDGMRWTDQYAEQARQEGPAAPGDEVAPQLEAPAPEPPPEPESVEEEPGTAEVDEGGSEALTKVADTEPQRVFCGACGQSIATTARFCSACGETQTIA